MEDVELLESGSSDADGNEDTGLHDDGNLIFGIELPRDLKKEMIHGMCAGVCMELAVCVLASLCFGNAEQFGGLEIDKAKGHQFDRTAWIVFVVCLVVRSALLARIWHSSLNGVHSTAHVMVLLTSFVVAFIGYAFCLNSAVIADCGIAMREKTISTLSEGAIGGTVIAGYNETFVDCHLDTTSLKEVRHLPVLMGLAMLFQFGLPLMFGFLFVKGVLLHETSIDKLRGLKMSVQLAVLDVADIAGLATLNFEPSGHIFFDSHPHTFNFMRFFLASAAVSMSAEVIFGILLPHYRPVDSFTASGNFGEDSSSAILTKIARGTSTVGINIPLLVFRCCLLHCGVVVDKVYLMKNVICTVYGVAAFLELTKVMHAVESMVGMMPGAGQVESLQWKRELEINDRDNDALDM